MQNDQKPNELGGHIQRSVEAAVDTINHMVSDIKTSGASGDRPLGEAVNHSVKEAVDEIKQQFYSVFQQTQELNRRQAGVNVDRRQYERYQNQQQQQMEYQQNFQRANVVYSPVQRAIRVKKKAKPFPGEEQNKGVFGLFTGMTFVFLTLLLLLLASLGAPVGLIAFCATFFVMSGTAAIASGKKKRQYKRFRQYISRFSSMPTYTVQDIMTTFQYSKKTVLKDWSEMIRLGIYPQAHISPDGEMIFLSDEAFMQYQSQYMNRYVSASVGQPMPKQQTQAGNIEQDPQQAELARVLQQGRQYINEIQAANHAIPGEVVSQKLNTLEDVCKRIFAVVEAHPEKVGDIRKFMDYYMPTTLKLVRTYREFDEQRLEGERIIQTKQDIEGTLDMINMAFANLLNDLFQNAALEASADISVLSTLFVQEGLKDNGFMMSGSTAGSSGGQLNLSEKPSEPELQMPPDLMSVFPQIEQQTQQQQESYERQNNF